MGIFPSAYAVDSDFSDWDSTTEHGRRERYILGKLVAILIFVTLANGFIRDVGQN